MDSADKVEQLFTWESLATLQGSVLLTVIVTNSLARLFGRRLFTDIVAAWVALAIAMGCQLGAAGYASGAHHWYTWLLAVANGFLVFSAALGLNQTVVGGGGGSRSRAGGFFRSWRLAF